MNKWLRSTHNLSRYDTLALYVARRKRKNISNCSYALLPPKKSWCQTISISTMEEGEEVRLDDGVKEVLLVLFNHTVSVSMYEQNRGHVCLQEHSYLNIPDGNSHCMLRSCSTHVTWWHVLVVICLRRFSFATLVVASDDCLSVGMKVFNLLSSCTSCLFMSVHLSTG